MKAVALALLSGILFACALPPLDWEPFGWFALAPLLYAVMTPGLRRLHAAGLGLLCGLASGAVCVGGHPNLTVLPYAYVPFLWLGFLFALLCVLLAHFLPKITNGSLRVLAVACAGVLAEWLIGFSPLPVGIALCQNRFVPLLQITAFTGIWGVSFLLYLVNAEVAVALHTLPKRHLRFPVSALLLFVCAGAGALLLRAEENRAGSKLTVAAVQDFAGVETNAYIPPGSQATGGKDAAAMTRALKGQARLVVWTEEGLGPAFTPGDKTDATAKLAQEENIFLIVGFEGEAQPKPYNGAALLSPAGETLGIHRKVKPYLGESQVVQAGREATVTNMPGVGKVAMLICFDTCYPYLARSAVRGGAQILAVPTYDPPVPRAALHYLHAAIMPFRAAENRTPLVRAEASGLSQIVAASGRILEEAPLYQPATLTAEVTLGDGRGTFYTRLGDWLPCLCLVTLAFLLLPRKRHPVVKEN